MNISCYLFEINDTELYFWKTLMDLSNESCNRDNLSKTGHQYIMLQNNKSAENIPLIAKPICVNQDTENGKNKNGDVTEESVSCHQQRILLRLPASFFILRGVFPFRIVLIRCLTDRHHQESRPGLTSQWTVTSTEMASAEDPWW